MCEGHLVWSTSEQQLFHLPPQGLTRPWVKKGRAQWQGGLQLLLVFYSLGGLLNFYHIHDP
jgi:hypothetical protein